MYIAKDMAGKATIMFGDTPVIKMDFTTYRCQVVNSRYLPYGLRGNVMRESEIKEGMSKHEAELAIENYYVISHWLARRAMPINRAHARWIYSSFGVDPSQSDKSRLKIIGACHGASILDKYWVKLYGEDINWSDVDIRNNPISTEFIDMALLGKSATPRTPFITPELTTDGTSAKAWRRHADMNLWLHKMNLDNTESSKMEVMVSNILDNCSVEHVHYEESEDDGEYTCACPCVTSDKYSFVTAFEFKLYCNANNLDFEKEILRIDAENYRKMIIVDYLISNSDRHLHNWGFLMDNSTMQIVKLCPLFDHNKAFDLKWIKNRESIYDCTGNKICEDAYEAIRHVNFILLSNVHREEFNTYAQFRSFTDRVAELGIKAKFNW